MLELALCRSWNEWASVFCCLFWLFVLESSEIKMIIIHQSMRAPMKAWKDLPSHIYFCFLRELSFIRTACFLLKLISFGLIWWAPSKTQVFCFCIWYLKIHFLNLKENIYKCRQTEWTVSTIPENWSLSVIFSKILIPRKGSSPLDKSTSCY